MEPDNRGVTALCERPEDAFELIFWELACDMNFDPAAPGPDVEEMEPWDLDDEYPCSLSEMLALLGGGDGDDVADVGVRSGDDAGERHDGVRGSDCPDAGEACAAPAWDYDVGAAVAVQREGSAGSACVRGDQSGAVEGEAEQHGVEFEAGV